MVWLGSTLEGKDLATANVSKSVVEIKYNKQSQHTV